MASNTLSRTSPEKEDMTRNSVHACFTNNCTAYHDKALTSAGFP